MPRVELTDFTRGIVTVEREYANSLLDGYNVLLREGLLTTRGRRGAVTSNIDNFSNVKGLYYHPAAGPQNRRCVLSVDETNNLRWGTAINTSYSAPAINFLNTGGWSLGLDPRPISIINDELVGSSSGVRYAGTERTSNYSTGTVSVANASNVVTLSSTAPNFTDFSGCYLKITGSAGVHSNKYYKITRMLTLSTFEVDQSFTGAYTGLAYTISPIGYISTDGVFIITQATIVTGHNNRAWAANGTEDGQQYPSRVRWSALPIQSEASGGNFGINRWVQKSYVDVYPETGGKITGMVSFDTSLIVFKEFGVFAIRGDVDTSNVDTNAYIDTLSYSIGKKPGQYNYIVCEAGLVWIGNDNHIYLFDGAQIQDLTDDSIGSVPEAANCINAMKNRIIVHDTQGDEYVYMFDTRYSAWFKLTYGTTVEDKATLGSNVLRIDGREIQSLNGSLTDASKEMLEDGNYYVRSETTVPVMFTIGSAKLSDSGMMRVHNFLMNARHRYGAVSEKKWNVYVMPEPVLGVAPTDAHNDPMIMKQTPEQPVMIARTVGIERGHTLPALKVLLDDTSSNQEIYQIYGVAVDGEALDNYAEQIGQ